MLNQRMRVTEARKQIGLETLLVGALQGEYIVVREVADKSCR